MGVALRVLRALFAAAGLVVLSAAGFAQTSPPLPYFSGPYDPGVGWANFNKLVQELNAILVPTFQVYGPGPSSNYIALVSTPSGQTPFLGLQPGADANAGIGISPNGNGNVVLFSSNPASTGLLQIANTAAWVPANGLTACPGIIVNHAPLGVSNTVSGYFLELDWLGRKHASLAC